MKLEKLIKLLKLLKHRNDFLEALVLMTTSDVFKWSFSKKQTFCKLKQQFSNSIVSVNRKIDVLLEETKQHSITDEESKIIRHLLGRKKHLLAGLIKKDRFFLEEMKKTTEKKEQAEVA